MTVRFRDVAPRHIALTGDRGAHKRERPLLASTRALTLSDFPHGQLLAI